MSTKTLILAIAALACVPAPVRAQTQVSHTTFSTAVTATATSVTLAAASGAVAGDDLYVEGERMRLLSNTSGTTWTVRRGLGEGATPARAHPTTAIVWTGGGGEFYSFNVAGSCTSSNERYLPHINTKENRIFDCAGAGVWRERERSTVSVESARSVCGGRLACREEFNGGHAVMQDDGTVKSVTDAEENFVYGSPLGIIEYREEQTKTTSSWVTINGQLDISADDTTASEGVEIVFGATSDAALNQVIEAGTNGACIAAMITIADISQVTSLQIGWRQNEAFDGAALYTGYTVWNTVGLTTTDGAITSSQEVSEATDTDLAGATWADTERRALKVCINSAGVPSAYYSDAAPDNEQPIYRAITMTETGSTATAGTGMVPFFAFVAAGTTDAGVTIQWVELSHTP